MKSGDGWTSLDTLAVGCRAVIRAVGRNVHGGADGALERRLLEIGFEEGRETEVRHVGPFGGDPIAVRVDGLSIAVRRGHASFVLVEPLPAAPDTLAAEPMG
jgi:ferrous iron transport protein A